MPKIQIDLTLMKAENPGPTPVYLGGVQQGTSNYVTIGECPGGVVTKVTSAELTPFTPQVGPPGQFSAVLTIEFDAPDDSES